MWFRSELDEVISVSVIRPENVDELDLNLSTGHSIVWNSGDSARLLIDNEEISLKNSELLFLTEFHKIQELKFEELKVIQFNRAFYCVQNDDLQVGCRGVLFYGAGEIPIFRIPEESIGKFELVWKLMGIEMAEKDDLKIVMLRSLLKRFLILSLREYRKTSKNLGSDSKSMRLIREFKYLVETHYRERTTVAEYAELLERSPKTLANVFKKSINRSPLQIIQSRRILEAKRLLMDSERNIQEVGFELGFTDPQTFSHFFKKHEGISPSEYRKGLRE